MAATNCKITSGVASGAGLACTPKQGGGQRLLLAAKEAIYAVVKAVAPNVLISDIDMNNPTNNPSGVDSDAVHKFYEIVCKDKTLNFKSTDTYNPETDATNYNVEINGQADNDSAAAYNNIRSYQGKPLVALKKENGSNGRWKIAGLGGGKTRGLFLTEILHDGGTQLTETQNILPRFKLLGDLDEGWLYLDAGSPAATEALVAAILA